MMINGFLLMYTDPVWLSITLTEFILFVRFVRGFGHYSNRPFLDAAQLCLGFVGWLAAHYAHFDFALDFALNVTVLTAYLRLFRTSRAQQAIYIACVFVLCTEIGKVVCVDLIMQPAYAWFSRLPAWGITLAWATISQLVALGALVIARRWALAPGTDLLSWRQGLCILLPIVPYMLVRSSSYMYDMSDLQLYWNVVLVSLFLSISTIVIIVANAHSLSAQIEKNELIRMQSLLREQHVQYQAHKRASETVRRQYHDLKHYVAELEALQLGDDGKKSAEELRAFTGRLRKELEGYDAHIETGNEVLDIVLTEKREACHAQGIRPVFYTDASCLSFMNAFDICAIFGNLLDNAIEAAGCVSREHAEQGGSKSAANAEDRGGEAAENVSKPEVHLTVRPSRGLILIQCRNPYRGELHSQERWPGRRGRVGKGQDLATTKEDTDNHGFGLKNVQAVAERYGGSLSWHTVEACEKRDESAKHYEDGKTRPSETQEFEATVVIPIPIERS